MKEKNKGITLVALVITIIILVILAGITLNLTLGQNGIFEKSQQAKLKTGQASAKEKLELALLDLQAEKYTNKDYDEKERINSYLENKGMLVDGDIVIVDTWKFKIDRNVLKIVENLEQEQDSKIAIYTPYVGTCSATIKVKYIEDKEEVEEYTYLLDGEEIVTNTIEECKLEDCLEPETVYKAVVIAKYNDGSTIESNEVTIKTEPRTYLFKNGDTCEEITGGWSAVAGIDPNYPGYTVAAPTLTYDKEEGYMDIYLDSATLGITGTSGGIAKVNKEIDYKQYRRVWVEATALLTRYSDASCITLYAGPEEDYHTGDNFICYKYPVGEKTLFKLNLYEVEELEDVYIYLQSHSNNGAVECGIYNVWLEK